MRKVITWRVKSLKATCLKLYVNWLLGMSVKFMGHFCKLGHRVDPTRGPQEKKWHIGRRWTKRNDAMFPALLFTDQRTDLQSWLYERIGGTPLCHTYNYALGWYQVIMPFGIQNEDTIGKNYHFTTYQAGRPLVKDLYWTDTKTWCSLYYFISPLTLA